MATAVHVARTCGGEGDLALLRLAKCCDRRQTAPAAPPEGLCLTRVGYEDYSEGDTV